MRKAMLPIAFVLLLGMPALAAPAPAGPNTTFAGNISDSMCGLKHTMAGESPKQCTEACVKMGAKYVLADESAHKVYNLSDQAKAKPYAGQNVRVSGTLKGDTIQVKAITAAK
ncbi:MAG: DUF5818 domain-containing protein [Terriglobia bacterium]